MSDSDSRDAGAERRGHFRGRARAGERVELRYRRRDGRATAAGPSEASAVTGNLGLGGAFVLTSAPEPEGTELELALLVPRVRAPLYLRAEVRWTTAGGEDGHGAGMGISFGPLEVEALRALSDYFASLGGGS